MRTGGGAVLLLGLGVGLVAGWFGRDLLEPAPEESSALSSFDPAAEAPREQTLVRLRGRAGARSGSGPGHVEDPAGHSIEAGTSSRSYDGLDPFDGGFDALVGLCAVTGRDEEFLRLAELAIENGLDPRQILAAVVALAKPRRAAILDALLVRHPDLAFDELALATAYRDAGAAERALEIVRRRLPQEPDFSSVLVGLLVELDPRGAGPILFALPGTQAWNGKQLGSLRVRLGLAGQTAAILPFLTRRLDEAEDDDAALAELIRVDPAVALEYVQRRLDAKPEDAEVWALKACVYLGQGDSEAAFDAYAEAARRQPDSEYLNELARIDLGRALPLLVELAKDLSDDEAVGALAKAYENAGESEKAMEVFLRAHKQDPGDGEWSEHMVELDPTRALALMKESLGDSPAEASDELLGNYADALLAVGQKEEAFDYYLAAFENDKADSEWKDAMAGVDPARAVEVIAAHLEASPKDAAAQAALGKALSGLGRRTEAIDALVRAIALDGQPGYFTRLGALAPALAVKRLRGALLIRGDQDELWGALGKLYRQQGQAADARAAYERARSLDPDDEEWTKALGRGR